MRDANGWYYVAGSWARAADPLAVTAVVPQPAWRISGPPIEHPVDVIGSPPGPNAFHVPGHYAVQGDSVVWKPGYWARSRPGWEWIPARWIHRTEGWAFRKGHWVPDPDAVDRPLNPPAVVESQPTETAAQRRQEPEPANVPPRDPIAETEVPEVPVPYVVVPSVDPPLAIVNGAPVRVIRPPGVYPYGPGGVVVPDAVPPFVQRLLNRILP
jgi:hypothetical protein